ncbi:uncharacterized protein APUU_60993A [Aspergillus puulaauensis]|uniref:HAT C-terminal dimerisation domain-containing protein n=1 Tax=Aspergillus puulaauensis TaxID=1220207 RepID=A0A7R7XUF0_9EURO|nr:uncharacterized protein APUU_60993A [Aspergillus puulaauensis]BCS27945.1 hypothetical protein APUU_60993A [Aspergillus puulaauensis]
MTDADLIFEDSQLFLPPQHDELTRYLESATVRASPRIFWKEHEHEFPVLASLARDIMSILVTGAGVERLFNSARDICHYRRGSLQPKIIQDIMLWMCTTRFDLQEQKQLILQEHLSYQEIAAVTEANETKDESFGLISDTEEDDILPQDHESLIQSSIIMLDCEGLEAIGHDKEIEEEDDDDDTGKLPLPDTQQRISSRKRKRLKLLDGYILGS